jgi:hypothetical protein
LARANLTLSKRAAQTRPSKAAREPDSLRSSITGAHARRLAALHVEHLHAALDAPVLGERPAGSGAEVEREDRRRSSSRRRADRDAKCPIAKTCFGRDARPSQGLLPYLLEFSIDRSRHDKCVRG